MSAAPWDVVASLLLFLGDAQEDLEVASQGQQPNPPQLPPRQQRVVFATAPLMEVK